MSFAQYEAPTNGNVVSGPVPESNGLVTATPDLGLNFLTGAICWLVMSVTSFRSGQPLVVSGPVLKQKEATIFNLEKRLARVAELISPVTASTETRSR